MGEMWPFAGRAEELRVIDAVLRGSCGPRGVVLAGEPGVGKTRLARQALALAAQRGMATRWVQADGVGASCAVRVFCCY